MATLEELGLGLVARLETISTLKGRAYWLPPDQINCPCAVVTPVAVTPHVRSGGGQQVRFAVTLYAAAAQQGTRRGAEKVLPYLDRTGAQSIQTAIEADTRLGGIASAVPHVAWRNFDALKDYSGQEYWGAVWDVDVRD